MSFKLCCNSPKVINYTLIHNNLLINKKSDLLDLILYLPEMESYQSMHNSIFSKSAYDDYLYKFFVKRMHLGNDDIKYVESSKQPIINKNDGDYYRDKICLSCQKVIFHKRKSKNKVVEIFRHIRNSISHGCFNLVNDFFVGFDHPTFNGQEYSAIIKVNYSNLIDTLKSMMRIASLEKLYKEVLKSLKYEIIENDKYFPADLIVKKDGVSYLLQFKHFEGRYINQTDIQKVINEIKPIDKTNYVFVLVVDSTYTSSKINSYVATEHISILDKKFIKEMLDGKDVLKELSEFLI